MLNPRNYKHIIGGKEHLKRGTWQNKYNKKNASGRAIEASGGDRNDEWRNAKPK